MKEKSLVEYVVLVNQLGKVLLQNLASPQNMLYDSVPHLYPTILCFLGDQCH